jgi:ABC-type transport system substrate-binding protein
VLVRQALNYATDKQAIVNAVFMGSGTVAKSPIPPNMMGYKKISRTTATSRKSESLLKQAGLEKGGCDIVVDAGSASV